MVFATDCVMEVPEAEMVNNGRAEIVTNVSGASVGARTCHHGHMPEIEITGDGTARGIWAMFDYVEWDAAGRHTRRPAGLRPLPRGVQARGRRVAHRPHALGTSPDRLARWGADRLRNLSPAAGSGRAPRRWCS